MALISADDARNLILTGTLSPTNEQKLDGDKVEETATGITGAITSAVDKVTGAVSGVLFRGVLVILGLVILYIGLQSYIPKPKLI